MLKVFVLGSFRSRHGEYILGGQNEGVKIVVKLRMVADIAEPATMLAL